MKTGKLIFNAAHPYQNRNDEKPYITVTFLETQKILAKKIAENI